MKHQEIDKNEFRINYKKMSIGELARFYDLSRPTITKLAHELGLSKKRGAIGIILK